NLNSVGAVFFHLETTGRIACGGFILYAPTNVGIGILQFVDIGNLLFAFVILREALDESERIRGQSQPLGKNFHPKHITLLCFERDPIPVALGVKLADIFAGWRNALCLRGLIIWLALGHYRPGGATEQYHISNSGPEAKPSL